MPGNAWPLVFRRWQLPSPPAPPATSPASPRPPALPWGELGTPATGSARQLGHMPCHIRAGPQPLHLPLSPTALGTAAPTLNNRFADVLQRCPHLHHSCNHICASALLQFRLSRGTNPDLDTKPPHSVSDHDVQEELLFCLSQCRALPCARPRCLGRGTRLLGSTAA